MLMSSFDTTELDSLSTQAIYPELAGKRILITGVTASTGVDIVRAFAEHKTQLVLHMADGAEAMQGVAEMAAQLALDVKLYTDPFAGEDDAIAFARRAVAAFGGLDAVINLIPISPGAAASAGTIEAVETRVSELLLAPCLIGRIAANRMRITHTEGLIINIATWPNAGPKHRAFAGVLKAALASLTRGEAETWGQESIRFNAVAPDTGISNGAGSVSLDGETDVARLALFLAAGRGKGLAGLVFDAAR